MRSTKSLLGLGVVLLFSASEAFAEGAKPEPVPVPESLVKVHGRRAMREAYFEQRRVSLDPTLNKSLARLEAAQALRAAEKLGASLPNWLPFGPAPIALGQTPTSTPRFPSDVSGRVTTIVIDEVNEVVYLGGAQGGVWSSADDGVSWNPLSDFLASTAVGALAIDPPASFGDDATLYLGTGEANGSCDSYAGVGVYKSTNSGATWTGPFGTAEFANRSISSIAIDRNDPNRLLATSSSAIFGVNCGAGPTLPDRGVFESEDGGLTWTKVTASNLRFSGVLQDPADAAVWWATGWTSSGSLFPAVEGGLFKGTKSGTWTWTQVAGTGTLPALATTWNRAWLTATTDTDFPGESVLYLANGQNAGPGAGRIFRSNDSGDNWSEVVAGRAYCNNQCFYDMPIFVEPGDADILYTGGAGTSVAGVVPSQFMRSNNGGTSFADKVRSADMSNALHADVHAITTWPGQPNRLWTGNDGGVWRSDDRGDNWVNVNSNLQLTQFSGCDLHPTDDGVLYAGSQDNGTEGREGTNGNIWKHLDFGDGGFARMDQGDPNNLVHTYFNQSGNLLGVGFTTDGFATTMGFYLGSFAPDNGIAIADRVLFYAPIHLDRGAPSTLYYGSHKLYRATNFFANPNSFVVLGGGADLSGGGSAALSAIETFANPSAGNNAMIIYTGSNSGAVRRSTNGGTSFDPVDVGGSSLFVSDILVDPSNSNTVWQSRSGFAGAAGLNVRKSVDGGTTWSPAGTGIPNIPVNALAFDPSVAGRLWAGTDAGAYYTEDGGANWVAHNVGLPTTAIFDLASSPGTNVLAACTHGRGAFILTTNIFRDGFETGDTAQWSSTVP